MKRYARRACIWFPSFRLRRFTQSLSSKRAVALPYDRVSDRMSQRTLVIINPAAARALRAWPKVRAALQEGGLDFDVYETAFAGDATRRTREALRAGYNTIA